MRKDGFSLLEILAVLAIMGLLAGLTLPAIGLVQEKAQRLATAQELRQIALAHALYRQSPGSPRTLRAHTIYEWAESLARETGLNEAALFWLEEDPKLLAYSDPLPKTVLLKNGDGTSRINPAFRKVPLSLTLVSHLPPDAPPATTPLGWTRGLKRSGEWPAASASGDGLFRNGGGFILFLNGQVRFFRSLQNETGALQNYYTGEPTTDIRRALPSSARILTSSPH